MQQGYNSATQNRQIMFYQRLGHTEVPKRGLSNYKSARVDVTLIVGDLWPPIMKTGTLKGSLDIAASITRINVSHGLFTAR
jgi:hypothetical protein